MKTNLILLAIMVLCIPAFVSCDSDDPVAKTCELNAGDRPTVEIDITFTATSTGDGEITQLTYIVAGEETVVSNPNLPWEIDVLIPAETDFSISANGSTTNGSITVAYSGTAISYEISGSDSCSHEND